MKKQIILLLLVLSCLLAACSETGAEKEREESKKPSASTVEVKDAKTIPEFYEKNLEEVTKITIRDGSTGAIKIATDKTDIEGFLNDIKDIKFILDENQEEREGWRYSIVLFQDGEEPFTFELTQIDGHYYHTKPNIFPIVDDFYKDLPVKEK